jgi:hypothetical protein
MTPLERTTDYAGKIVPNKTSSGNNFLMMKLMKTIIEKAKMINRKTP